MPCPPLSAWFGDTKDGVLVGVEGYRTAMRLEVALESIETGCRARADDEAQLHKPAGRIVDEYQKRARIGAILKPPMVAAVDLDQFARSLAS